jgi:hypothetical protein
MNAVEQPTAAADLSVHPDELRRRFVMRHCPNHLRGLELAPSSPPIADRGTFDVTYVAVPGREVPGDLRTAADVEWHEGRTLAECLGGRLFGYAVASHVFEQMPNPLGWIHQVLDCLEEGGRLAILLPHRERSINRYRQDTTFAQVVAWAIENPSIPTPMQVMDFLSQSFDDSGKTDYAAPMPDFSEAPRHYTDSQAMDFARFCWNEGHRLDVHCTTWTPESFTEVFARIIEASLLDATLLGVFGDVSELSSREFLVVLEKTISVRGRHAK